MSEHEFTILLEAIRKIESANKTCHEEMRKSVELGLKAVQANIDAYAFVTNKRLEGIENHLKKQNGNIAELWKTSDERKQAVQDFRNLETKFKWIGKNWLIIMLLIIIGFAVLSFLYDIGAITGFIDKLIDKI